MTVLFQTNNEKKREKVESHYVAQSQLEGRFNAYFPVPRWPLHLFIPATHVIRDVTLSLRSCARNRANPTLAYVSREKELRKVCFGACLALDTNQQRLRRRCYRHGTIRTCPQGTLSSECILGPFRDARRPHRRHLLRTADTDRISLRYSSRRT